MGPVSASPVEKSPSSSRADAIPRTELSRYAADHHEAGADGRGISGGAIRLPQGA